MRSSWLLPTIQTWRWSNSYPNWSLNEKKERPAAVSEAIFAYHLGYKSSAHPMIPIQKQKWLRIVCTCQPCCALVYSAQDSLDHKSAIANCWVVLQVKRLISSSPLLFLDLLSTLTLQENSIILQPNGSYKNLFRNEWSILYQLSWSMHSLYPQNKSTNMPGLF